MTQEKLPEEEWEALVDIFFDIEDALEQEDDKLTSEYLFDLNTQLDRLEEKYGTLAVLVATRADYCEDLQQQLALYQQAIKLSEDQNDEVVLVQSLESLYLLYREEIQDSEQTGIWQDRLEQAVEQYGDEWLCEPED